MVVLYQGQKGQVGCLVCPDKVGVLRSLGALTACVRVCARLVLSFFPGTVYRVGHVDAIRTRMCAGLGHCLALLFSFP